MRACMNSFSGLDESPVRSIDASVDSLSLHLTALSAQMSISLVRWGVLSA